MWCLLCFFCYADLVGVGGIGPVRKTVVLARHFDLVRVACFVVSRDVCLAVSNSMCKQVVQFSWFSSTRAGQLAWQDLSGNTGKGSRERVRLAGARASVGVGVGMGVQDGTG